MRSLYEIKFGVSIFILIYNFRLSFFIIAIKRFKNFALTMDLLKFFYMIAVKSPKNFDLVLNIELNNAIFNLFIP